MKLYVRFLIIWFVNASIFLLANNIYPRNYVLGNAVIPPVFAGIFAGFLLTIFTKAVRPILNKLGIKTQGRLTMIVFYLGLNSFGIWLIARLAIISAFGIPAFYWAFPLGGVAWLGQWLSRQIFKATDLLDKDKKKKK